VPSDEYLRQVPIFSPGSKTSALQLAFDKKSTSAESYRAIRSSILYQIGDNKAIRSLVFTSAVSGEGKTTVVSNLGAAMATSSRRVLVVDADLRRPRLHEVLGAENDQGLADLLNDDPNVHIEFNPSLIAETAVPNLFILPAGKAGSDAPELLSSDRLQKVMGELTKYFDVVLVDTPPVLPYSDARSVGKIADGLVLIVRAEATDRRSALLARDIILQDRIPLIGTILTDWNAKKNTLHYYRTYRAAAWEA
jgi:capsular exopolysaccharide synthesis family protein